MQLTDAEIRAILIREKKRKLRRKRVIRRVTFLVIVIFALILAIGLFINRGVLGEMSEGRGVIFIDPGHGGGDPGTEALGRKEKDDNLSLALQVKKELEGLGFKVYMSRSDDTDVDREKRGAIANQKKAKLMVSLHRNQASEGEGVEVWIPSSNTKEAQLLGKNILDGLAKQGFYARGVKPGTLVDPDDDYYENSVPTMPSCIVEVGFVSNKGDNTIFDKKFKENAHAIASAIEATYAELYENEEK